VKDAYDFFDLNVRGTFEVFEAAASAGIDKVILISTTSVYRPDTRYGSSKILAELIAEDYRIGSSDEPTAPTAKGVTEAARKRRTRRNIPEVIVCELSFSGQAMTARQIAEGIGYNLERTEIALERLEQAGRLLRDGGRWAIAAAGLTQVNEHAVSVRNGKLRTSAVAEKASRHAFSVSLPNS
jgi:hypothetical protein